MMPVTVQVCACVCKGCQREAVFRGSPIRRPQTTDDMRWGLSAFEIGHVFSPIAAAQSTRTDSPFNLRALHVHCIAYTCLPTYTTST